MRRLADEYFSGMYETEEAREAYRRGAQACYESGVLSLDPRDERAIWAWLTELQAWRAGDPPPAPHEWFSQQIRA